jgi:hypothetical protein
MFSGAAGRSLSLAGCVLNWLAIEEEDYEGAGENNRHGRTAEEPDG